MTEGLGKPKGIIHIKCNKDDKLDGHCSVGKNKQMPVRAKFQNNTLKHWKIKSKNQFKSKNNPKSKSASRFPRMNRWIKPKKHKKETSRIKLREKILLSDPLMQFRRSY